MNSKAAILLSGGIDSIAVAFWKRPGFAFTIDYGQKSAQGEIRAAAQVAAELEIKHEVIVVDCRSLGSGDLVQGQAATGAPAPEWWPFRNQLLVTLAVMRGYSLGIEMCYTGSLKSDSFHCDGSADFYDKIDGLVKMQEGNIRVESPAIAYTAVELVRISNVPRSLLAWSHSCHKAEVACGQCRGCYKNREVMSNLGYET